MEAVVMLGVLLLKLKTMKAVFFSNKYFVDFARFVGFPNSINNLMVGGLIACVISACEQHWTCKAPNCHNKMCKFSSLWVLSINQSINQTTIAPISPAKTGSVAVQPNQCSTAKSRKQFYNINRQRAVTVSMGERPNQRDVSSDIS